MIYTDYVHLIADTVHELHLFCKEVGINRCWYDSKKKHPHYDIPKKKLCTIKQEVKDGNVLKLNKKEIVTKINSLVDGGKIYNQ